MLEMQKFNMKATFEISA